MVDIGCGRGHIAKHLSKDITHRLYQCDYAEVPLVSRKTNLHYEVEIAMIIENPLPLTNFNLM